MQGDKDATPTLLVR